MQNVVVAIVCTVVVDEKQEGEVMMKGTNLKKVIARRTNLVSS